MLMMWVVTCIAEGSVDDFICQACFMKAFLFDESDSAVSFAVLVTLLGKLR